MPSPFEKSGDRFRRIHGKPAGVSRSEQLTRADTPEQREADRLRSTARWQRVRMAVLVEADGLCALCVKQGRTPPEIATEVDHVVPLQRLIAQGRSGAHRPAGVPDAAFDRANLQALCAKCHDRKTASERRRGIA